MPPPPLPPPPPLLLLAPPPPPLPLLPPPVAEVSLPPVEVDPPAPSVLEVTPPLAVEVAVPPVAVALPVVLLDAVPLPPMPEFVEAWLLAPEFFRDWPPHALTTEPPNATATTMPSHLCMSFAALPVLGLFVMMRVDVRLGK